MHVSLRLAFAIPMSLPLASATAQEALVLDTPRYEVHIDVQCAEGTVSCDHVSYRGVHRKSGKAITLLGRTAHTTCADGETPCRFLGYEFANGPVHYFVSDAGELVVSEGARVLLQEAGTWRDAETDAGTPQ